MVCCMGVREQCGCTIVCTNLHELLQANPFGTQAVPSHSSFAIELAMPHGSAAILACVSTIPSPQ